MKEQVVADFSGLPLHGMATASPTWWGTLAFMLIEGTGFALAIAVYLYLMSLAPTWPIDAPRPGLLPGTLVTLVLIGSVVPNYLISRWAEQQDLRVRCDRPETPASSRPPDPVGLDPAIDLPAFAPEM